MQEDTIKAIVQKIVPDGNHGPFAVATSEKIDSSITFSLEPTVWKEKEWPEPGTVVLLGRLRQKRAGWRAKTGRFFKPSDEQEERRNEMKDQYRRISSDEIDEAAEHNPQRALLMVMANSTLAEASEKASGKKHEPKFCKSGWRIAIETPRGVIGLWSCWLDNQFYLGYPKRTSFLVAALPPETAVRIANKYRVERADTFLLPPKEEFDLNASRDILARRFTEEELRTILRENGIEIPTFELQRQALDRLIMDTLGVERAQPVPQVDATAVGSWDYEGEYKDPDKPLIQNSVGQIVAYRVHRQHNYGRTGRPENRLWAAFYSQRVAGDKGRVWIDHSDWNSNGYHFDVVDEGSRDGLRTVSYGHDGSMGISTFPFSFWNEYAPDGPTTEGEVIQTYRNKFLTLACELARQMGGANAVNIDYSFVLVPEQLQQVGYENVSWLRGHQGHREGWGNDIVRAEKTVDSGKETIVLKSANSIVPWSNIRRVPYMTDLNTDQLLQLLTF